IFGVESRRAHRRFVSKNSGAPSRAGAPAGSIEFSLTMPPQRLGRPRHARDPACGIERAGWADRRAEPDRGGPLRRREAPWPVRRPRLTRRFRVPDKEKPPAAEPAEGCLGCGGPMPALLAGPEMQATDGEGLLGGRVRHGLLRLGAPLALTGVSSNPAGHDKVTNELILQMISIRALN